jgi:hypothetical protein
MSDSDDQARQSKRHAGAGKPHLTIPVQERKAFFSSIVRRLGADLPPDLRTFRHRGDFNLMKIWYAHYRIHYEVVIDQQIDKIELALHFEDGPASSLAFLALLDARILEIKDLLGPEIELERWTQSWARIYQLLPLGPIDDRVCDDCARRLVSMISLLQPIIDGAGIRLDRPGI